MFISPKTTPNHNKITPIIFFLASFIFFRGFMLSLQEIFSFFQKKQKSHLSEWLSGASGTRLNAERGFRRVLAHPTAWGINFKQCFYRVATQRNEVLNHTHTNPTLEKLFVKVQEGQKCPQKQSSNRV